MSSTETFAAPAAVAALTPWRGGGDDEGDAAPAEEGENGTDGHSATDWGTLRSALRDPYGQHFRPHLFGI